VVSTGRNGGYHLERLRAFSRSQRALEAGRRANPAPGYEDFRPDRHTAELASAYLAEARPRFLFVSLGETDEHAHHDRYRGYLEALHFADSVVGRLRATLRDLEEDGVPTALLVTTDHGRADHFTDHGSKWPESSRSFLFAAGSLIVARGHVADAQRSHLADLAPTVRALSGLRARRTEAGGRVLEELRPRAFTALARSRE
jgi:arylsulfatase A-like enzyme